MKSLKQLLDQVNDEIGFDVPAQYFQSPDPNVRQLIALANRSAITLRDMRLQLLSKHGKINLDTGTTAFTTDGRIKAYALPADYYGLVPDTTFQSGRLDCVILPTTAPVWAYLISRMGNDTLPIRARIIQDRLEVFSPELSAQGKNPQFIEFEYISKFTITSAASGNDDTTDTAGIPTKDVFTDDSDIWLLDDPLIELDIKWRYKREKGLDWEGDYQSFVLYSNELRARDGGSRTIGWPTEWPYPNEPFTNLWRA